MSFCGFRYVTICPLHRCKIFKAKRCHFTGLKGHFPGVNRSLCGFEYVILGPSGVRFLGL